MEPIRFTVPAVPVAQPRQRVAIIGGHAKTYTPTKHAVNAFKASVQHAWMDVYDGGEPLSGPLAMRCVFVMPRPKAMLWKSKPMPRAPYTAAKNDWDNLGKSVSDSLVKLAYRDDGQLCRVLVERWIAAGDEQPHVEVTIEAAEAGKE